MVRTVKLYQSPCHGTNGVSVAPKSEANSWW